MTTLPENLRKNGFDYRIVLSGRRSCIFLQQVSPKIAYYEVFRIRIRMETVLRIGKQVKIVPEHQLFPGNEDFGKNAWSTASWTKAIEIFNRLENEFAGTL